MLGPNQSSLKFSPTTCGKNIKLDNDNTKASSVSRNPASICFLSQRLQVEESIQLVCTPEKEGERQPSRYDIKLHICESDPTTLKDDFKHLFDALEEERSSTPLTTIENFEKDDCNGKINITLSKDNSVVYRTARGKQNSQTLKFKAESGVWIVFNLYRVKIESSKDEIVSGEVEGAPEQSDQVDSLPVRPRVTAVPPVGESVQPRPIALPATNVSAVQQRNETSGSEGNRVKFLEGRLKDLEEEVQCLRRKEQQEIPRQISNLDMNIDMEELGDVLNVQKHFPELIRSIDTMAICDHLYAKSILTEDQLETIHGIFRHNKSDANRHLLKVLKTKPIEKSDMVEVLKETQQQHLLKLFYPRR